MRRARSLAIFDIDGTLTNTVAVDARCFLQTFALELAIDGLDTDWSTYAHATDSGIADAIVTRQCGRAATTAELARLEARCARLLAEAATQEPGAFAEVPGAAAVLAALRASPEWEVAIASGGWQAGARVKLGAAALDVTGVPAAFSNDGPARETIVTTAIARAAGTYWRIVCVGDGAWDVRSARRLGLPLVGVGSDGAAAMLRAEGVTDVVPDLRDADAVLHALAHAGVPGTLRRG